jgi:LacI family transcriptional regulator
VSTAPDEVLLDSLQDHRIPAVAIVRRVPQDRIDTVVFQDFDGSYVATQHLIDLGHHRIGYIGGGVQHSSNKARWQGYLAAIRAAELPLDENLVKLGTSPRSVWGEVATLDLLHLPDPPTAIYAASNAIMPGVVRTLHQQNITVPDRMSLICFDDVDWFSFSTPPITAINVSHARLAETAVDLLTRRIDESNKIERTPVFLEKEFELILRSSTGPRGHGSLSTG